MHAHGGKINEQISFTIKRNDRCEEFITSETYGGLDQEIEEEGGEKAGGGGRKKKKGG
jgi:hypothetical protein